MGDYWCPECKGVGFGSPEWLTAHLQRDHPIPAPDQPPAEEAGEDALRYRIASEIERQPALGTTASEHNPVAAALTRALDPRILREIYKQAQIWATSADSWARRPAEKIIRTIDALDLGSAPP
jgi:hypothetical protein